MDLSERYRPKNLADLIGQDFVVRTLSNALCLKNIPNAYLFQGRRGTGKTSAARIVAKALVCEGLADDLSVPCGECPVCLQVDAGSSVSVLEVDAASNRGIDDIRSITEVSRLGGKEKKVLILDEIHQLTGAAEDAFLKTLETPSPGVLFILCTTEPYSVEATLQSRCQRLTFKPVPIQMLSDYLASICELEDLEHEPGALSSIASAAEGVPRDALKSLDLLSSSGSITLGDVRELLQAVDVKLLYQLTSLVVQRDVHRCLALFKEQIEPDAGGDFVFFVRRWVDYIRTLCLLSVGAEEDYLGIKVYKQMLEQAHSLSVVKWLEITTSLCVLAQNVQQNYISGKVLFEMEIVRLCQVLEEGK